MCRMTEEGKGDRADEVSVSRSREKRQFRWLSGHVRDIRRYFIPASTSAWQHHVFLSSLPECNK